ncbi:MAG: GlxA family transcriptional regulator [Dongiaceae bacterium]
MFQRRPVSQPERIGFFVVPRFSLIGFAAWIDSMRSANRMSGSELYSWHILSTDGRPVVSSSGVPVMPEASIADAPPLDAVVIVAGLDAHDYDDKAVFAWLRRLARTGVEIGASSLGPYVLAKAGLLDGYRCTVHWENIAGFAEAFPELEVTGEIFEIDRDRFTCSGGIAGLDMMLHLIATQHGQALANAVSEQFIHDRIRDRHDRQRMALPARLGVRHPKLVGVIQRMEKSLEEPISRAKLAREVGLSTRQLERLFRKYLGCTPTRHYLELRLEHARRLLLQTDMSVLDVALACGFVSASHFSKCFRELFRVTPRAVRLGQS